MEILKKLGFRQADEMDQHISTVALGWSWVVMALNLLIWGIVGVIRHGEINVPLMVLSLGLAVYYSVILFMRKRLYDDPQE